MNLASYLSKGEIMKKLFCFILVVTVMATIFNGLMQNIHSSAKADDPGTVLLDYITPVIAYADSDTLFGPGNAPPPPPPPFD
jgi:hypothetical protein